MKSAFVRERSRSDKRGSDIVLTIRQLIDKQRKFTEPSHLRHTLFPNFELKLGNPARQITIAGSLAVAVNRPLNLNCACLDGDQSVRDTEFTIVVGVYPDLSRNRPHY